MHNFFHDEIDFRPAGNICKLHVISLTYEFMLVRKLFKNLFVRYRMMNRQNKYCGAPCFELFYIDSYRNTIIIAIVFNHLDLPWFKASA
jgi:hypothetical protein